MAQNFDARKQSESPEKSSKKKPTPNKDEEQPAFRVRTPKNDKETIGVIEQLLGNRRMLAKCIDQKIRMCRIPGKIRTQLKLHEGDYILIQKWEIEKDTKGDVLLKYTPREVEWLKNKGFIKGI